MKLKSILMLTMVLSMTGGVIRAQLSPTLPFMSRFTPRPAVITEYADRESIPSACGLVRLPNGKVALMTREHGEMKPFHIRAIETGYWDTRYEPDTDYDSIFADMREMGANTAYVMIHWEEIETSDNHFDFTFADRVVAAAARQRLKLNWVLFLHAQTNGVPPGGAERSWTFHLDDRDSCSYTMQWPRRNGVICRNVATLAAQKGIRPLHLYGHPEIFGRIRRMLYNLAVHYRDNETVIGVQLGNEEGFSFLDESDFNPITQALYEEWRLKTNKCDYAQFKREAMNWWWRQFTTAYHEGDPYKILTFNLDAGQAEAGDPERVAMTGTSASTYADGNLDAIGTMFYRNWGYRAIAGLDARYNEGSYIYGLPLLIPSEIGIGRFNPMQDFHNFVLHTLERAAQGFGVYCYGEVRRELPDSTGARRALTNMFGMIRANEEVIYGGLPGPGAVRCTASHEAFRVSHLHLDNGRTLAMLYQPVPDEGVTAAAGEVAPKGRGLALDLEAYEAGCYAVTLYRNGAVALQREIMVAGGEKFDLILPEISSKDIIFIDVNRRAES